MPFLFGSGKGTSINYNRLAAISADNRRMMPRPPQNRYAPELYIDVMKTPAARLSSCAAAGQRRMSKARRSTQ
jgi:hypothetical protein